MAKRLLANPDGLAVFDLSAEATAPFAEAGATVADEAKRVYYLSLEFLIGRLLRDAIANLGHEREYRAALAEHGVDLTGLEIFVDPVLPRVGHHAHVAEIGSQHALMRRAGEHAFQVLGQARQREHGSRHVLVVGLVESGGHPVGAGMPR